ncbi:MAG: lysylphosphatidylglycerol synthase transmembrane domain-containing protein [Crocinitomicaceae bacterium]
MKATIIKILKIVIPIGIGVYLTWYFFNGLDEEQIQQTKDSFFDANYFWVFLGLFVAFLSHLSRSYRWLFQLEPLGYKPKLSNAYHAVMSGYVINYTVPRSGEFARAGLLTSYEKVPFEKGFATIVIERVVDVIMLGIVVFISGLLQANSEEFSQITATEGGGSNAWLIYALIAAFVFGVIGLIAFFKIEKFKQFVLEKLKGFLEGLKSIWTMKKKWAYIGHTIFIWTCYVGTIWIFAQAFPETSAIDIGAVFGSFVVGAAAIALLPGGIGAYPAWVNAVLVLYGINFAGFGIFIWVAQTAMMIILGLISLFLIQRQPKLAEVEQKS